MNRNAIVVLSIAALLLVGVTTIFLMKQGQMESQIQQAERRAAQAESTALREGQKAGEIDQAKATITALEQRVRETEKMTRELETARQKIAALEDEMKRREEESKQLPALTDGVPPLPADSMQNSTDSGYESIDGPKRGSGKGLEPMPGVLKRK